MDCYVCIHPVWMDNIQSSKYDMVLRGNFFKLLGFFRPYIDFVPVNIFDDINVCFAVDLAVHG